MQRKIFVFFWFKSLAIMLLNHKINKTLNFLIYSNYLIIKNYVVKHLDMEIFCFKIKLKFIKRFKKILRFFR